MNSKIQFLTTILLVISVFTFGQNQVDVKIQNMTYLSGGAISDCGIIDFEDNATVTVQFGIELEKPSSLVVGTADLKVITKTTSNSSPNTEDSQPVQETFWSTGDPQFYNASKSITLYASDFNTSGGELYVEFAGYESCKYSIEKDEVPSFSLEPINTSVSCGSDAPKTFTVTPSNIPSGLSVEYQWSVGSGWLRNGNPVSNFTTTTTSVTLVPENFPPNNVNVTPVLDGDSYPTLTSTVSLKGFNPAYQISGANQLCSSATYSINNLPNTISVTSWNVSNTNIATISGNGNQATLTATGNGTISVNAVVTNSCGQTATISKQNIIVGSPTITSSGINGGHSNISTSGHSNLNVNSAVGVTQYYWTITPSTNCSAGSGPTFSYSGTSTYTSSSRYASIQWNDCVGTYAVACFGQNSCGQSYIGTKWVNVFNSNGNDNPCDDNGSLRIKNLYQNGSISINKIAPLDPCDDFLVSRVNNNGLDKLRIYNSYGRLVMEETQTGTETEFVVNGLKKGIYFVKYQNGNGKMITKKIIVE